MILIIILWSILSFTAALEYRDSFAEIDPPEQLIAALIFALGGPVFALNQILVTVLDYIFPEGWKTE